MCRPQGPVHRGRMTHLSTSTTPPTPAPPPAAPTTRPVGPTWPTDPSASLPAPPTTHLRTVDPRPGPIIVSTPWRRPEVAAWLASRRNAGATPATIATDLVAQGWDADVAADTARRSLRRSDHHRVLYGTMCWSMGLGALGLATGMHQLLADTPDPRRAALSFTLAVVLLPLAGWCVWVARALEATSPHAVWSPTRRMWFATLATSTAVIGLVRLITYVYLVIASLTGARARPLTPDDQFQVLVTLLVAVPLFTWSLREWRRSDVVLSGLSELAGRAIDRDRIDDGAPR